MSSRGRGFEKKRVDLGSALSGATDPCVRVVVPSRPFYGSACYQRPLAILVAFTFVSFSPSIMRSVATQRAPSPTNTTFSGISSYRTEPYRSHRDKSSISSSPQESYQVARAHYDELSKYLASYLAKGSISPSITFHLILPSQSPLQNQQIPAQQHDRNSRGLHASNSRNYPQTSMMNC